ncbi:hypothetical protein BC831DRAFT_481119 [Entophlyctis helioformis]|nr:hypothetical protein BC831DRAFT_481119 [Entophlyctis helioformis]
MGTGIAGSPARCPARSKAAALSTSPSAHQAAATMHSSSNPGSTSAQLGVTMSRSAGGGGGSAAAALPFVPSPSVPVASLTAAGSLAGSIATQPPMSATAGAVAFTPSAFPPSRSASGPAAAPSSSCSASLRRSASYNSSPVVIDARPAPASLSGLAYLRSNSAGSVVAATVSSTYATNPSVSAFSASAHSVHTSQNTTAAAVTTASSPITVAGSSVASSVAGHLGLEGSSPPQNWLAGAASHTRHTKAITASSVSSSNAIDCTCTSTQGSSAHHSQHRQHQHHLHHVHHHSKRLPDAHDRDCNDPSRTWRPSSRFGGSSASSQAHHATNASSISGALSNLSIASLPKPSFAFSASAPVARASGANNLRLASAHLDTSADMSGSQTFTKNGCVGYPSSVESASSMAENKKTSAPSIRSKCGTLRDASIQTTDPFVHAEYSYHPSSAGAHIQSSRKHDTSNSVKPSSDLDDAELYLVNLYQRTATEQSSLAADSNGNGSLLDGHGSAGLQDASLWQLRAEEPDPDMMLRGGSGLASESNDLSHSPPRLVRVSRPNRLVRPTPRHYSNPLEYPGTPFSERSVSVSSEDGSSSISSLSTLPSTVSSPDSTKLARLISHNGTEKSAFSTTLLSPPSLSNNKFIALSSFSTRRHMDIQ